MSRVHAAFGVLCAASSIAGLLLYACGGKVDYGAAGTLDDGGVFRGPDGEIVFSPGSACANYDAAHFLAVTSMPPTCVVTTGESQPCVDWASDAGLAVGDRVPFADCADSRCRVTAAGSNEWTSCTFGPQGDAYCAAFYQQFALGTKHANA